MSSPILAAALALYLLATLTFGIHVVSARLALRQVALGLTAGGFAMHLAALAVRATTLGYASLFPFQEGLSLIACIMVGLFLAISLRADFTIVGALVAPIAFLFSLSAYAFETGPHGIPPALQSVWLPAHVAPAFVGYAIFSVAFCLSLTYLVQERQLKVRRTGDLFRRLPSLETLDNLNHRFITWGFALFTIGLITGSLLAMETWGEFWSWEPVQVWSVITWLLYAALVQTRAVGWRGRRAATLTIAAFAVLILSFLSINLVFPGRHGGTFGS